MVDMLTPSIPVWEGCEPTVSEAIKQLQVRWRPSSTNKHIVRLIGEFIDPAIAAYATTLPAHYLGHIPGAGTQIAFSEIARSVGLTALARAQRQLLRAFILTQDGQSARDQQFVATLESLIGLIAACARKRPAKSKVRDTRLDSKRRQGLCRFCGDLAELTLFANGNDDVEIYPLAAAGQKRQKTLRLSDLYCVKHRPKTPKGEWNPEYRKAKRSVAHFDRELARLRLQSAKLQVGQAQSGDPLVDSYIYHYVRKYGLQPADDAELRHHARQITDMKLSDRKKQIVMLLRYGATQSEIARKLGIKRQAVFKALASIPADARKLPTLPGFSSDFLVSTKVAN